MDPLSITTAVISLVSTGIQVLRYVADTRNSVYVLSPTQQRLIKTHGRVATIALKRFLPDTWENLEKINQRILPGSEEIVLAFKTSYISDCTQTAVAVSYVSLDHRWGWLKY